MSTTQKPPHGCENSSPKDSSPPAPWTSGASRKSNPTNSMDSPNATSSPGSEDGLSLFNWRNGPQPNDAGQDLAPVNHSPARVSSSPKPTSATSGPPSSISSASAALSESLGSRLQARLAKVGSMEYRQTWSRKVTPAGRPYWAHTASAPRISARDFTGWPTPQEDNANNAYGHKGTSYSGLPTTAQMAGDLLASPEIAKDTMRKPENLETSAPSVDSTTARNAIALGQPKTDTNTKSAEESFTLAGWCSPASRDWKDTPGMATTGINPDGSERTRIDQLPRQAAQCPSPWATPRAEDAESCGMRHSRGVADTLSAQAGQDLKSSIAGTAKPAGLNPDHSRWLMGFPVAWGYCGATAMQSSHKPRQPSSKPSKNSPQTKP